VLALVAAAIVVETLTTPKIAFLFLVVIGLPSLTFTRLLLLRRPLPPEETTGEEKSPYEWYPISMIVVWATLLTACVIAAFIGLGGEEQYKKMFTKTSDAAIKYFGSQKAKELLADKDYLEAARFMLPAMLEIFLLFIMFLNLWLAAKSAQMSGLLRRPWPSLLNLDYPLVYLVAFLLAVGVAKVPGHMGVTAMAFVGAFTFAYAIIGLSVVYLWVPDTPIKPIIVATIFMSVLITKEKAIYLLALLGLVEPLFDLRRKALDRPPPPESN
jgi:hypothetical protein